MYSDSWILGLIHSDYTVIDDINSTDDIINLTDGLGIMGGGIIGGASSHNNSFSNITIKRARVTNSWITAGGGILGLVSSENNSIMNRS